MVPTSSKSVKGDFTRALASRSGAYSFYAAVRRMEQLLPDRPRVGEPVAGQEPVMRFAQIPHLQFPPSEIYDVVLGGGQVSTMQVYSFGLFGPNGALPLALTEYAYERSRHFYDLSMQRFLDIFHDRLIALFYRGGTRAQPAVSYDNAQRDFLSRAAERLCGMPRVRTSSPLPSLASVAYARELAHKGEARSVCKLLEKFFKVPVRLRQFVPGFMRIGEGRHCRLGKPGVCELGHTTILGSKQRSITDRVDVVIGPVSYTQFQRLAPGGKSYARMIAWLKMMGQRPLHWELVFQVKTDGMPPLRLGQNTGLGCDTLMPTESSHMMECRIKCAFL